MVIEAFVESNDSAEKIMDGNLEKLADDKTRLVTSNNAENSEKLDETGNLCNPVEPEKQEMNHSSRVKPAIVVRETSIDTSTTLVDNTEDLSEDISDIENSGTPLENKILNSNLLKSDVNSSNPSLISDVSSDCSDLEDIYLEPEDVHNKTDIAFAEDLNVSYEVRSTAPPTFEIDLNDVGEKKEFSPTNHTTDHSAATDSAVKSILEQNSVGKTTVLAKNNAAPQTKPGSSGYWENPVAQQPKPVSNLTLRHVTNKAHSDPLQSLEIGCFGFRGEDYYRNCTHIVAEARQREKLKDFKGAQEMLRAAVEILIAGVQHDPDPMRREGELICLITLKVR